MPVGGRPVLAHQFAALEPDADVVVVAGFRAQLMIDAIRELRPDTAIALNHEYLTTGTAASVGRGAAIANEWIVSLDGDLLVDPADLARIVNHPGPCLGITPARSAAPVWAQRVGDDIVALSQEDPSPWEWSGLVKLPRTAALALGDQHVYPGLAPLLPLPALEVDCVEIDDEDDLRDAEAWVAARECAPR